MDNDAPRATLVIHDQKQLDGLLIRCHAVGLWPVEDDLDDREIVTKFSQLEHDHRYQFYV